MKRSYLFGAISAVLALLAGWILWQGRSETTRQRTSLAALVGMPPPAAGDDDDDLPEGDESLRGNAPPVLRGAPQAPPQSREEKRFNRYDKDRNGNVTRIEMLATRTKAFKKLDTDGNNLLSFEEWAVKTSDKFAVADADKDGRLSRGEFAATAPKRHAKPHCGC